MYALEGVGAAASPLAIRPEDTEPKPEDIPVEQGTVAAAGVDGVGNNDLHAHAERRQRGGQGSGAQPNRGARP